jgi:hypothetical protein
MAYSSRISPAEKNWGVECLAVPKSTETFCGKYVWEKAVISNVP